MTTPPYTLHRIGPSGEPVMVLDDAYPDPQSLVDAAASARFEAAANHYPGVRAALPPDYAACIADIAGEIASEVFGRSGGVDTIDASFSMVTTPPDALSPRQRLPHCDAFDPDRLAMVHYLCEADAGGTAFYRHRATGFETVDAMRAPILFGQIEAELRHGAPLPAAYVADDTPLFERIFAIPPRFNRIVLYRSFLLHSGMIPADAMLSPDPREGRLTVTGFFAMRGRA